MMGKTKSHTDWTFAFCPNCKDLISERALGKKIITGQQICCPLCKHIFEAQVAKTTTIKGLQ